MSSQPFILGRKRGENIAAVEGLVLSPEMCALFDQFETNGIPPEQQKKILTEKLATLNSNFE